MKGKCISACNRGQRNKSDFYQTPYSMTEQFLGNEIFDYKKTVLEPACGNFAIATVIKTKFKLQNCYYDDLKYGFNFLEMRESKEINYIITNPPFSLAGEFIQKSKEVAKEKFAMLLPLYYLHGQKRYETKIFTDPDYPLTKVYVFTRYPMLTDTIRDDGKYNTGCIVYAWFVWERNPVFFFYPMIHWINNINIF